MTQQEHLITILIDELKEFRKKEPSKQHMLDDFAKAAMQEMVASVFSPNGLQGGNKEELATYAYDIAEAMMNERERRIKG